MPDSFELSFSIESYISSSGAVIRGLSGTIQTHDLAEIRRVLSDVEALAMISPQPAPQGKAAAPAQTGTQATTPGTPSSQAAQKPQADFLRKADRARALGELLGHSDVGFKGTYLVDRRVGARYVLKARYDGPDGMFMQIYDTDHEAEGGLLIAVCSQRGGPFERKWLLPPKAVASLYASLQWGGTGKHPNEKFCRIDPAGSRLFTTRGFELDIEPYRVHQSLS